MEDTVKNKAQAIARLLEEHKGMDTVLIDVRGDCTWTDQFVITTVRSQAHLAGLIRHLNQFFKTNGISLLHRQKSLREQGWVLLDCGDIVVHLMEKEQRDFYELEKLWFKSKVSTPS